MLCGRCGQENPEGFAFCGSCGAALDGDEAGQQQRKTVTVVFCDLAGSTALGDSTDPEVLEVRLRRYFERMQTIVERHGGTVEKFIGDAVVAIFGVPVAHEDDALRALRAAAEMRDAMPELELRARIGVNTGEILTSKVGTLVTGDAVNVAARLEQSADAGEVLVGAATRALVGAAAEAEELAPLALKGKPEPVPAFRLLAVGAAPDRLHDRPFVGRTRELELLGGAWERASAEPTCELVTVLGEAGVGKSRLVAEALERMNARVVRARCLPYGEEITYWPVVEVIKQLGALPSDPAAAAAIRSLLGESEQATSVEEIAWAFRKLLGEQAPLVVLVDDIQWGADTFLDLVEHVALLSAAVPLLLVCVARPELLDRRPAWSVAVRLQPLDNDEVGALIGDRVAPGLRARIERAAGGNPLFVTEMLAMAGDGEDEVEVPPTLSALLTARLDQLDPSERRIVERGAVEGEIFHRGAVQALSPDEPHVTPRLAALVRRELIRPHPAQLPGDDGFRFRHLLIRDAAYDALPKAVRAELHERFGAWIEEKGALVELDEVVGYHFEQAAGYRAELGLPDPALALRAGDRLAAAGQRALDRGDERAAARLLERALTLTRPLRLDVHAELDLAQTHWDDPERAAPIADDAAVRAGEAGDETGAALARAMGAFHRLFIAQCTPDELEALLLEARRRLEEAEDHVGLAYVWSALGYGVANGRGRTDDWAAASEQSLHHSRLAGRQGLARATDLGIALCLGSRPADEALVTVERLLAEIGSPWLLLSRAWLLAMLDRGEEARRDADEAYARLREQSGTRWPDWHLAEISGLAGDHEDASNRLRIVCEWLEATEQLPHLETYLSFLGRSLCRLGRFDEAAPFAERARAIGETIGEGGDSVADDYLWRQVLARVHAHRGELAEAERLAREAVAGSEQSDSLDDQCLALWDLAEVLAVAERPDEAEAALEQALERCQRKKNLARAAQVRRRLDSLRHDAPIRPGTSA
jgi:class 3 adenylate cyclase